MHSLSVQLKSICWNSLVLFEGTVRIVFRDSQNCISEQYEIVFQDSQIWFFLELFNIVFLDSYSKQFFFWTVIRNNFQESQNCILKQYNFFSLFGQSDLIFVTANFQDCLKSFFVTIKIVIRNRSMIAVKKVSL